MADWMAIPGWSTAHLLALGGNGWRSNCGRYIAPTRAPVSADQGVRRCSQCEEPRGQTYQRPRILPPRAAVQSEQIAVTHHEGGPHTMTDTAAEWGVVELFGHVREAGRIAEVERYGGKMLQLDVLDGEGEIRATQLIGHGAIYRLTPTDEATARAAAVRLHPPVWRCERPELPAGDEEVDDEPDDEGDQAGDELAF